MARKNLQATGKLHEHPMEGLIKNLNVTAYVWVAAPQKKQRIPRDEGLILDLEG